MKQVQIRTLLLVLAIPILSLPGCEKLSSFETSEVAVDSNVMSWRDRYLQLGQDTYQDTCAQCHDEGIEGAY